MPRRPTFAALPWGASALIVAFAGPLIAGRALLGRFLPETVCRYP